jgi:hypothetical protein
MQHYPAVRDAWSVSRIASLISDDSQYFGFELFWIAPSTM